MGLIFPLGFKPSQTVTVTLYNPALEQDSNNFFTNENIPRFLKILNFSFIL